MGLKAVGQEQVIFIVEQVFFFVCMVVGLGIEDLMHRRQAFDL